jgi:hypothetical protein
LSTHYVPCTSQAFHYTPWPCKFLKHQHCLTVLLLKSLINTLIKIITSPMFTSLSCLEVEHFPHI